MKKQEQSREKTKKSGENGKRIRRRNIKKGNKVVLNLFCKEGAQGKMTERLGKREEEGKTWEERRETEREKDKGFSPFTFVSRCLFPLT